MRARQMQDIELKLTVASFRLIEGELARLRSLLEKQGARETAMFNEYCRTGKVAVWEQSREELGLEDGEVA